MNVDHIFITGDMVRPNPDGTPSQIANVEWLFLMIAFQLEMISGMKIKKLITSECGTIDDWLKTENVTAPCWHLEQVELVDCNPIKTLVIGFEMPANSVFQLSDKGFKLINLFISPNRFMNDLQVGIEVYGLEPVDRQFICSEEHLYVAANLMRARMLFESPLHINEKFALIVGQTCFDRVLIKNGVFLNLLDFKVEIETLSKKYKHVFFKPHPYSVDGRVLEYMESRNISTIDENIYALLSCDNLVCVAGINSSVLFEAKYFNKKAVYFNAPSVHATLNAIDTSSFLSYSFWSSIFGGDYRGYDFPVVENQLRKSIAAWWGHPDSPHALNNKFQKMSKEIAAQAVRRTHLVYFEKLKNIIFRN